jgi:putative addiction module killer protein
MEIRNYADASGKVPFLDWLYAMKDKAGQKRIIARLARVMAGNLGDCKPLRDGVMELKVDFGPGYRVYMSRQGTVLVLLLCAGDKSSQSRDIELAIEYLDDWKQRGKP